LESKSKIPPQFRRSPVEVCEEIADGVDAFGFHCLFILYMPGFEGRHYTGWPVADRPHYISQRLQCAFVTINAVFDVWRFSPYHHHEMAPWT
jgi:hypothetical protein